MTNGNGPALTERITQRGREVVVERLRDAFAHQLATHDGVDLDPERVERMVQEAAGRAGEALRRRSLAQAAMEELGINLSEALAHPVLADVQALGDAGAEADAGAPLPAPQAEAVAEPVTDTPLPAPEAEAVAEPVTDTPLPAPEAVAEADSDIPYPEAETDAPLPAPEALPEPSEGEPHHLDLGSDPEHAQPWPTEHQEVYPDPVPMVADAQALRLSAVHLSGIETLYQGEDDLELRLSEAGLDVLKRSNGAAIGRLEWSEIETVVLPAPKRGLRNRRRPRELHVSTDRGQAQFELPGLTDQELHEYLEPTLARLSSIGTDTRAAAAAQRSS
jgi:hypothetical protein